jgi:hypothetical protein
MAVPSRNATSYMTPLTSTFIAPNSIPHRLQWKDKAIAKYEKEARADPAFAAVSQ